MTLELFDTHAHLNVAAFDGNVDAVVERAKQAGLVGIMVIGIDAASSRRACDLAAEYPGFLYAAVGIQPNSAAEASDDDFALVRELAGYPGVRAIGETGLDCYWDDTPIELQHQYFDDHLQLCRDTGLPMVIHMRDSGDLIVEQLAASVLGACRGDAFLYRGSTIGRAMSRAGALHQLCRHGHVQEER